MAQRQRAGVTTVLVVEDNPAARGFVRSALELEGYRVREAVDGHGCLAEVRREAPDVLVLDLVLPDLDGLEVARRVRAEVGEAPAIVAFTGAIPATGAGLPTGVDAVVLKPADPEVLVRAVAGQVHARHGRGSTTATEAAAAGTVAPGSATRTVSLVAAPGTPEIGEAARALGPLGFTTQVVDRADVPAGRGGGPGVSAFAVWVGRAAEGFAHAAMLRADRRTADVPVVLVADAEPSPADLALSGRVGATEITTLPGLADAVVRAAGTRPPPWGGELPDAQERLAYLERQSRRAAGERVAAGGRKGGGERDALTGLLSREQLAAAAARVAAATGARHGAGGLVIGLDGLGRINDALGRQVGDRVLQGIAGRLLEFEPHHAVGRLESDRFGLVAPEVATVEELGVLARAVLDRLAGPVSVDGMELYVTVSVGAAVMPADPTTGPRVALEQADLALRRAKDRGGNQEVVYEERWEREARRNFALERDLRETLGPGGGAGLMVHYQPLVTLPHGTVSGAEALVRWEHPSLGWLAPAEFVPIAERSGLIAALGEWVLTAATEQTSQWHAGGLPPLTMAVNVGAGQLHDPGFVDAVAAALASWGLDPGRLELEITETTAMADLEHAAAVLEQLAAQGVRVALDDFGTGYSSLAYLRRFPVDVVKLDRAFVAELPTDAVACDTVGAVVALGRKHGFHVVGEGVETDAELERLVELGCDGAQGFLFSPPVQPTAFAALVADGGRFCAAPAPTPRARSRRHS